MKISVSVKTRSKKESVEKQDDTAYVVRVNTPPVDGKANERVVELLADHFQISKSSVQLLSGHKSKKKVFEIK
ncbi:MAG: DUF167 domain-containing protein [Bacteriovoracaceae bacterium]|nr:DUF167 domain-containing protein [Bacteriovoracaceae bacterium]